MSNTIGLVFGSSQRRGGLPARARRAAGAPGGVLGIASAAGGLAGAILLLALASSVFRHVVPFLILGGEPPGALRPAPESRYVDARPHRHTHGGAALFAGVFATGIYGGYFGAAQGIILLALLGTFLVDDLQRLNAAKNVLALIVNGVAAVFFAVQRPRGVAGGGGHRHRIDGRVARSAVCSAGGCRPRCCGLVVVLVGVTVSIVLFV